MNVVTTGYSRDREFEADLQILKAFEQTGHDPAKASNFFKSLLTIMPPGTEGTTTCFPPTPAPRTALNGSRKRPATCRARTGKFRPREWKVSAP